MKVFLLVLILAINVQYGIGQNSDLFEQDQYLEKSRFTNSGLYTYQLDSAVSYAFQTEIDSTFLSKSISNFNEEGNLVLLISYKENMPSHKREVLYGENTITSTYYTFSVDNKIWLNKDKYIDIFNDKELLISKTRLEWKEEEWQNYNKYSYEYNENEQLILKTHFLWDDTAQIWHLHSKNEIIYDNQGREILEITQWLIEGEFKYFSKTENMYSQLVNTETNYIWEPDDWMKMTKSVETRAENGEWKEIVGYSFNHTTTQWDTSVLRNYSYYPDGREKRMINTIYNSKTGEIRISTSYENFYHPDIEPPVVRHIYADDLVTVDRKTYYYYTAKVTGTKNSLAQTQVFLSPNPVLNEVTINTDKVMNEVQLDIIDLNGKSLFSKLVPSNRPINIQHLPTGLLLFNISKHGRLISRGKIIRKN